MFRSLRKVRRNKARKTEGDSQRKRETGVQFEKLEDKLCLAFVGFFDGITLDLLQTFDSGDVVVDNSGINGAFRVTDNSGALTFVDSTNVTVTMLDGTANQLDLNINTGHTGDVQLNLGDGPRDIVFGGALNQIGGNLEVFGGTGPQFVNLSPNIPAPIVTTGSATFDMGDGFDTVYNNENFVTIGTDLTMTGVNLFRYTDFLFPPLNADLKVGGNLTMDTSNESVESFVVEGGTWHDPDPTLNMRSIISGDFIYIGGDDIDHVNLNDTYVQGDIIVDLGEGIPFFGDPQNFTTTLTLPPPVGPYAEIDGNIEITVGNSNLGNIIDLDGVFNGSTITLNLSDTSDEVIYSMLGAPADVTVNMGAGDDSFTLNQAVNVLDIDFGNDLGDVFINNFGQFTFDSDLTNFHWFDHLYTVGDDTMRMNQLMDTGDIVIDNNGGPVTGIDWQMFTAIGGASSTTPAANLILTMLPNTGNNVEMDLINPVIASITMNLGDGDRNIDFTGSSNNPLRDIVINAGAGMQNVELSVNAPLAVATLDIDLGTGFDTVDDDANNLLIAENLFFTGVNHFENDGILAVTSRAIVDVSGESEDTVFANNQNMIVGIDFTYVGGGGQDEVRLNGATGTSIVGDVSIDLGDNNGVGTQSALLNSALTSVGGNLEVLSIGSSGPDVFALDALTTIGGNIAVDLGDGPNSAVIQGLFSGTTVTYVGGSGVDNVVFGTTGNPAQVSITLGDGDDTFTLLAGASINTGVLLVVDFGDDNDTFINNYGQFDFPVVLQGLDGFDHFYNPIPDTLTSTQVSDPGPVTVDNNGPGGAIQFIDGGTNVLTPVTNLTINMLDGSGTQLDVDLDAALAGELNLNLGDGLRDVNFTGSDNNIGSQLTITAGNESQSIELAQNASLAVPGDVIINLGSDSDILSNSNNIIVGGNFMLQGVNLFSGGNDVVVGGNFSMSTSADNADSTFNLAAGGSFVVNGNFTYTGNVFDDSVFMEDSFQVDGNVIVNMGAGTNRADFDDAGGTDSTIGGSTTVTGGGGSDTFLSNATQTSFGGDIDIDLGGGANEAEILGTFGGSDVTYQGGSGMDLVTFGTTGNLADVDIELGGGNDTFTLEASAAISPTSLRVDFGGGNDDFVNNYGAFDFDARMLNWHGYNQVYDHLDSSLRYIQVSDTGNITIDNNGAGGAIRLTNGFTTEMTPADNIRVNLLSNTSTNVTMDYDLPQAGNTVLDLKEGDREIRFTGDSNQIGGLLRIEAGREGVQNVHLAVNADLNVTESLVINLRNGVDAVDDGANDVVVGSSMVLRAVNTLIVDNTLSVGGGFTMNTRFDGENSILDNDGGLTVVGNLNYLGGDGVDAVLLNDGAIVIGNTNIELGTNLGSATAQVADLSSATLGRLRILGGDSLGGTQIITDASTSVAGDVILNFSNVITQIDATLLGTYGGTYGTYRGGSGVDNVVFGAVAPNMNFVSRLRAGNDVYVLEAGTDLIATLIDFGGGNDTFIDNLGQPYPFPVNIKNL